ncbi:hypothetical protein [Streptacidiphilus rugosus]|uniref:hypothetical protein n=1 Tax=Streptacidiphilus rugosus TaxID=405783 RepID=UPI0005656A68|nr:hypothetical protein [Streptacidiphilus rugosus]
MGAGTAVSFTLEQCLFYGVSLTAPLVREVTLINIAVFGLVFGAAATLVFGFLAAMEAPLDTSSAATPSALLSANRREAGRLLLLLVPLLTLAVAGVGQVVVTVLQGTLGPLVWGTSGFEIGAVGGAGGSVAYILTFTAWGQWLVLVRF